MNEGAINGGDESLENATDIVTGSNQCCKCCEYHTHETQSQKSEVDELRNLIATLTFPAEIQRNGTTKDLMQIRLEKKNDALIKAVEELSSNLIDQRLLQNSGRTSFVNEKNYLSFTS